MTTRRTLFALPLAAAGCRRKQRPRIAVIPKSTAHIFWVSVEAGARAAGREFDVEILWNGAPLESDFSRQIQIVDAMAAQRVDGIALAAAEREALVAPIERAAAAGIPVVVFDSGADTDKQLCFISTDNYGAGKLAARKLGALLNGKGTVAVLLHAPGSFSTMDRERGFKEELSIEFPGVRLVAEQYGMGDRGRVRAAAENILAARPDLNAFFTSTEPGAAGIGLALAGRGLAGKVRVVGFDSSPTMEEDLRSGALDATVVQNPFRMGYESVRVLAERLRGKTPPRRIDLPGTVVTGADLDKPEIKTLLHPNLTQNRP